MSEGTQTLPVRPPRELLIRVEQVSAERAPKQKDLWEKLQVFASILTPLVVGYFTYAASGQLDNYIKQRELEVKSAAAMSKPLADLLNAQTDAPALRHAVELASFGPQALPLLTYVLQDPNAARANAARKGMELLSSVAPVEVCTHLVSVLENGTGLYRLSTQESAVEMVGQARCSDAFRHLKAYTARVEAALKALQKGTKPTMFADEFVDAGKLRTLLGTTSKALELVRRNS